MKDCKEDFSEILNMDWPMSKNQSKHQPMNLTNRAKIFLPFAALKGYEEEIADRKSSAEEEFKIEHTYNLEDNADGMRKILD